MPKKKGKSKKRKFNTNFRKTVVTNNERQEASASSYGFLRLPNGISMFNAEPGGRMKFDIIPYEVTTENHPDRYDDENVAVPGSLWYRRPFKIHRNIGVQKDAVVCPRSENDRCPICEYKEKRLREGAEYEEVKDLKISKRHLYTVIPKGSKNYKEEPHLWEMSHYLFEKLLKQEVEENTDYAVFPDLEEGLTLKVRFDSQQIGESKPFAEASRIDFYERDEPYDESILDNIPNLDECLEVLSYKKLEAKFMELDPDDIVEEGDEEEVLDEDEELEPRRGKSTKKKSKKEETPVDPEEEFEDEDDFEDEEELDEEEFEDDFEDEDEMAADEFEEEEDALDDEDEEDDWDEEFEEEFEDAFDEEFEDDFEEEEEKPKKKKSKSKKRTK
jgi:hypothetical protein